MLQSCQFSHNYMWVDCCAVQNPASGLPDESMWWGGEIWRCCKAGCSGHQLHAVLISKVQGRVHLKTSSGA